MPHQGSGFGLGASRICCTAVQRGRRPLPRIDRRHIRPKNPGNWSGKYSKCLAAVRNNRSARIDVTFNTQARLEQGRNGSTVVYRASVPFAGPALNIHILPDTGGEGSGSETAHLSLRCNFVWLIPYYDAFSCLYIVSLLPSC